MTQEDILNKLRTLSNYPDPVVNDLLQKKKFELGHYSSMTSNKMTRLLCYDFYDYLNGLIIKDEAPLCFVMIFDEKIRGETHFEVMLSELLQNIHQIDCEHFIWNNSPCQDNNEQGYTFSFGGRLFHVTGMHPKSLKPSRKFYKPMVIFYPLEPVAALVHSA